MNTQLSSTTVTIYEPLAYIKPAATAMLAIFCFTGSAVALHCVKAHRQSQWRSPNFNPL